MTVQPGVEFRQVPKGISNKEGSQVMLTTNDERTAADKLRARAAELLDQADRIEAARPEPVVYFVPVDPADATVCEGCE